MSISLKKIGFRFIKYTGIGIAGILLLLFILPYLMPDTISNEIKGLAKRSLKGDLEFSKARLSFFNHFPALTLTLYDFSLKGSAPFEKDTLIASKQVAFGIDIRSLFRKKININQIFLTNAFINIQVDEKGQPNYNVYVSQTDSAQTKKDTTNNTALKIEQILIEKSHIVYNDRSLPMLINLIGFNYVGKGDFSKSIFDLTTQAEIDMVDFVYNNNRYVVSKKVYADLITKINTSSLSFIFEKNNLKINQLPVEFKGKFEFLKNGYGMDFNITSSATELRNVVTALPPQYLKWLEKTEVNGTSDIAIQLKGNYIAETGEMPDLSLTWGIRSGYISYNKAQVPISNLFLNFETKLPGLNPDSLYVNIDSIFFNMDKDYFSSLFQVKGIKEPVVHAKINTEIDLEKWHRALGIPSVDFKGIYSLHLTANGKYARGQNPKSIRPDTVITSIPSFNFTSSFKNGYFKYDSLPQAVKNIGFNFNGNCVDDNYHHANISIENLNANVLDDYLKGFLKIKGGKDFEVNSDLKGLIHLASVKQVYPLDGLDIKGDIHLDIVSNGKYDVDKKLFPKTNAHISMSNGSVLTKYYPHPIEKITVDATLINTNGTPQSTSVLLKPIGFVFEDQPFTVKADLKNFNDMKYDISSNGIIDVGRVYQVFSRKGLDVKGFIKANFAVKGLQSDATSGRYEKLKNSGSLEVKDITVNTEYFPQPFVIKSGKFSFKDDKVWFNSFNAYYGKSDFSLNGYLSNVINYITKNQPLTGSFDLKSNQIVIDEFMAFSGSSNSSSAGNTGVILVPANLDITFNAAINSVLYNSLKLTEAKGQMQVTKGTIGLKQTGFTIIGAPVVMDATYQSLSPKKATFDYHVVAKEFDIKRAYNEIKLFHDLASAAGKAQGIVGLDYQLRGRLDANMHPVFPSLEGGGTLSVKKVKIKGLKLFSSVSKETGRDGMNDPDISKVDIKTKIKNNIITIEPFKMRIAGFRPKMQGEASFDGNLNLKFRLGLPPLGIFGIPMTITGTQDKPIIKMRRGTDNKPLQEKSDDETDLQEQ
jgi:AsmA protein